MFEPILMHFLGDGWQKMFWQVGEAKTFQGWLTKNVFGSGMTKKSYEDGDGENIWRCSGKEYMGGVAKLLANGDNFFAE